MTPAWILFGCLTAAVAWSAILTVAAKGALRRLDAADRRAQDAEGRAALAEDTIQAYRVQVAELAQDIAARRRHLHAVPHKQADR